MKKFTAIAVIIISCLVLGVVWGDIQSVKAKYDYDRDQVLYSWIDNMNVRHRPDPDDNSFRTVARGEKVTYLGERSENEVAYEIRGYRFYGPYLKVLLADGHTIGWVFSGGVQSQDLRSRNDPGAGDYQYLFNNAGTASGASSAQAGGTVYVSASGSDANDGLTASAPKATLSAAVELVKRINGKTILVSGNYKLQPGIESSGWYIDRTAGVSISGGWNSGFTAQNTVSVLNGNHVCGHVVYLNQCNGITLSNFLLTGGDTTFNGAGIYLNYSMSNVIVCTVSNNSANYGGGIALYGSDFNRISGIFTANHALTTAGGVFLDTSSDHNIIDCLVYNNSAVEKGAGMATYQSFYNSISAIISNNSTGTYGGGVYLSGSGNNVFTSTCVIYYNHCGYNGGAIYVNSGEGNTVQAGAITSPNYRGDGTSVIDDLSGI